LASRFRELYDYCQSLTPKVSRKSLKKQVEAMFGEIPVCIKATMDTDTVRGIFLSCNDNTTSELVKQAGNKNIIVLARGLNPCWDRFVYTKELMHVFDTSSETVNSSDKLTALLNSFEIPPTIINNNAPYRSEIIAFWRALSCLCPETSRQEILASFNKGHIDHYGIALKLRIPEQYVPYLLDEHFLDIIAEIK
jgi:hypothetical protein